MTTDFENIDLAGINSPASGEGIASSNIETAMAIGRAGYWVYYFKTGKFTFSESVESRLSAEEVRRINQSGLWAIIETDDLPPIMKEWGELISDDKDLDLTYRVTTELDGTMWQRSVGKVQYDEDGKRDRVIAFVTDITADVAKNQALVEAEDASRAKNEFLARMNHEVKTPLNAIVGLTDSLRDETLDPDVRNTIELIEQSAENLHTLLSEALDHTRLMSQNIQVNLHPESPEEIIRDAAGLWRPKCSLKGLELNIDIDPSIPKSVPLDRYRIQQCLNSILSNAIKFTSEGSVSVHLKRIDQGQTSHLVMIIRDTGIGMDPETLETIFKPFEQADTSITRNYGGTGLGMTITKQLVDLMGGQISVKSTPGEGTAFAIGIPVKIRNPEHVLQQISSNSGTASTEPDKTMDLGPEVLTKIAVENPKESKVANAEVLNNLSILCVEDNPTNQHVVKKLIGNQVSTLRFANNGREALDKLAEKHVDIILMDIHMPVMDGIEATLEIRNSNTDWADVIIIALTADSDYQQTRICRNLGMNDTIGKPVKRKDILDALERAMNDNANTAGRKEKINAA